MHCTASQIMAAVLMTLLASLPAAEIGSGLGISPAMVFIENIRPGESIDLGAKGLQFTMVNGTTTPALLEMVPSPYSNYTLNGFQAGYEWIPDPSWAVLSVKEATVPAKGSATSGMVLTIPDRPECYNRHWVLGIETGAAKRVGLGAALRVQSQVLIETVSSDTVTVGPRGEIGVAPARVEIRPDGATWKGSVQIRNGTTSAAILDVLTLRELCPAGREHIRPRYFGTAAAGLMDQDWAQPERRMLELGPETTIRLAITATPARVLKPGERIDEVLFLARRASETSDVRRCREYAGRRYDRVELLRLRYLGADLPEGGGPK